MVLPHPVRAIPSSHGLEERTVAAAQLLHDTLAEHCTDHEIVALVAHRCLDVARTAGPDLTARLAGAAGLAAEATPHPDERGRRLLDERFGAVSRNG